MKLKYCSVCPESMSKPPLLTLAGAVELRNALNDKFGIELSPTVTLDYPSVAALASHIAAQLTQDGSGLQEEWDEPQASSYYNWIRCQLLSCFLTGVLMIMCLTRMKQGLKAQCSIIMPAIACAYTLKAETRACLMQAAPAAVAGPSHQQVSAEVQSVVAALVGRAVGPEEPLMEAGLDSLGKI